MAKCQCSHWITSKARYCRLAAVGDYCVTHSSERVACPVDPSHTVAASKLAAHVLICNATKDATALRKELWYVENINGGGSGRDGSLTLDDVQVEEVAVAPRRHCHDLQAAQIVKLIPCEGAFVDLGGGRGGLAAAVRAAYPDAPVIVVERASRRYKYKIDRIRCDLRHVHLAAVFPTNLVGVAKHLCGAATDLALKALVTSNATAVVIATCCHHACNWDDYVGRATVDHDAFDTAVRHASWATSPACDDKRTFGRRSKRLIDRGRIAYLQAHGFTALLRPYCDASLSPENIVIQAWRS